MGRNTDNRARLFFAVPSKRARNNKHKLKWNSGVFFKKKSGEVGREGGVFVAFLSFATV